LLVDWAIANLTLQSDTQRLQTRRSEHPAESSGKQPSSVMTPAANASRHNPSAIYFTRARIRGKLFRHSLRPEAGFFHLSCPYVS